jgi:hypothetical protein
VTTLGILAPTDEVEHIFFNVMLCAQTEESILQEVGSILKVVDRWYMAILCDMNWRIVAHLTRGEDGSVNVRWITGPGNRFFNTTELSGKMEED